MKRILTIIAALLCICGCEEAETNFWSTASHLTIAKITGDYSLISAEWSSPIDLSGEGLTTNDMLYQLQLYGWTGILSIRYQNEEEFTSVLYRSSVLTPEHPQEHTQVNLYVPYPEKDRNAEHPIQKQDRCNIDISVYQFYYQVDSKGGVTLFGIDNRRMSGEGGELTNVTIRFEEEYIYFDADTSLYDWSTASWQDGHMSLIYEHN